LKIMAKSLKLNLKEYDLVLRTDEEKEE